MAYIYGDIPFFECLVRKEYTRNLEDGAGQYMPAVAHAVQCKRGRSLQFQVIFTEEAAGAAFLLPIEALCWKPVARPFDLTYVQPWDCFAETFTVHEASFVARGATSVLPARQRAQYRFTIDWAGSDLADHFEQHKHLHVCFLESGLIGAFPNNRLLWEDPAFWTVARDKPEFKSLAGEFRAEGNQSMFRRSANVAAASVADVGVSPLRDLASGSVARFRRSGNDASSGDSGAAGAVADVAAAPAE